MLCLRVCRFVKSSVKPNIGLINNNVPQVFKGVSRGEDKGNNVSCSLTVPKEDGFQLQIMQSKTRTSIKEPKCADTLISSGVPAFPSSFSNFQKRNMTSAQASDNPEDRIVWIDMEMTGLDLEKHRVLEVACLVTDANLNLIAEGPELVLHQPQNVLDSMNEWCVNQHTKSGLVKKVLESKVTEKEAEQQLLDFVKLYTPEKKCPLAGNSVSFDRYFMLKFFPRFEQHLHYRIIDVSSVKELCRRWFPDEFEKVLKKEDSKHRALEDIKNSIIELQYYRKTIFRHHDGVESVAMAWC